MSDHRKLVFIIGAGASNEAELPLGNLLKQQISSYLHFKPDPSGRNSCQDDAIQQALTVNVGPQSDKNIQAANFISRNMPLASSIDEFVYTHRGDKAIAHCAKIGIVKSILDAENNSSFNAMKESFHQQPINFDKINDTWYLRFFALLNQNATKEDITNRLSSISLVIFNYDRCIEHFLYNALMSYCSYSHNETLDVLNNLEFFHPYGTVGALPWQDADSKIGFGDTANASQLKALSENIKTFSEGIDEKSNIDTIRKRFFEANTIVFLGFAYHEINLNLLFGDKILPERTCKNIIGTAKEISIKNKNLHKQKFLNILKFPKREIEFKDVKCSRLLSDFSGLLQSSIKQ